MHKKEVIAMLLAGGQGSRLGVLTGKVAKPAVAFGGKYRIIDFPLSNCVNSGIDTVGVLTQYQPLRLNAHIGIGIPWDLDRTEGGVTILPPRETIQGSDFYSGTANAIWQNMDYMDEFCPEYVLILPGDQICRMDYGPMLEFHKTAKADLTVACVPVPAEEVSRHAAVVTDAEGRVKEFRKKPDPQRQQPVSAGIYIFTFQKLKEILSAMKGQPALDFETHVVPAMLGNGSRVFAYEVEDYWRDVETLKSYWEANMELLDDVPAFSLYEEHWRIYTKEDHFQPQYLGPEASVTRSLIGSGCEIYGSLESSVLSSDVCVGRGAEVKNCVLMKGVRIGNGAKLDGCIIAENTLIGEGAQLGVGEYRESSCDPGVYCSDLVTVAENSVIPAGVRIGKNTAVSGVTAAEDYRNGELPSGAYLGKEAAE